MRFSETFIDKGNKIIFDTVFFLASVSGPLKQFRGRNAEIVMIAGDFDVPSSREDVDRDSSWNQWLRNEIHTLFIEALEVFKVKIPELIIRTGMGNNVPHFFVTSTHKLLYNTIRYNTVLDITRFKDGSQKCKDYIEK